MIDKIGRAIPRVDFFAVIISKNSINSEWVHKELQLALEREFEERRTFVLPLLKDRIEKADIPPFVRDKLYGDFSNSYRYKISFQRLLEKLQIGKDKPFSTKPQIGLDT